MPKFKLLQGNFITGERGNRKTFHMGDIVESKKDLSKFRNKFERLVGVADDVEASEAEEKEVVEELAPAPEVKPVTKRKRK